MSSQETDKTGVLLPPITELRFRVNQKQSLRLREFEPTNAVSRFYVFTSNGGLKQDQGVLSRNSSARISSSMFYTGAKRIKSMAPGATVYLTSSSRKRMFLVQLEDDAAII